MNPAAEHRMLISKCVALAEGTGIAGAGTLDGDAAQSFCECQANDMRRAGLGALDAIGSGRNQITEISRQCAQQVGAAAITGSGAPRHRRSGPANQRNSR